MNSLVNLHGGFKIMGQTLPKRCPKCHTNQKLSICHKYLMTKWFNKIPVPVRNNYYALCPHCHKLFPISQKQAKLFKATK